MLKNIVGVFAVLSLLGGVAVAQKGGAKPVQAEGGTQYKAKTVYDFDDDIVEGDLVRPDGEFVDSRKSAKHSSLIKIRENFMPEMLKSAEDQ